MATKDIPPMPSIIFFTSSIVAILEPLESRISLPSNSISLLPFASLRYFPSICPTLLE